MSTKVLLKKSSITGKAPAVGDLSYGELAINYADGVLYYKKSDDTIQQIGGSGGSFTYASTAPSSPSSGDSWVDSNSGVQYVYINDGDSSQWVELGLSVAEGITPGGTTGQVLTKSSNSDYDTEWTTLDALPSQTGNNGKFLTTNGSAASWGTVTTYNQSLNTTDNVQFNNVTASKLKQTSGEIAIGSGAGVTAQDANTVAIGKNAGNDTQGDSAVAIGWSSGYYTQGPETVAVGAGAGNTYQQWGAVAIGKSAGYSSQGYWSVALGYAAGQTSQPDNSIIINATGSALNGTESGLYVAPVRNDETSTSYTLFYDTTTKEITYAAASPLPTTLNILNRSANVVSVSLANGTLSILNHAGSTISVAVS